MTQRMLDILGRFETLKVLVIGDAILDGYVYGSATRLCREAPAPVVSVFKSSYALGGAANAAHNINSLGAQTLFASCVGQDQPGDELLAGLQQAGIPTGLVVRSGGRRTLAKQRVVADGQVLVRFDQGSTAPLTGSDERQLVSYLEDAFDRCDAVLISDYAYGVVTDRILDTLQELQLRFPRPLVVDARDLARYRHLAPTAVKPNYAEAMALLGSAASHGSGDRVKALRSCREQLLDLTGAALCTVTLDMEGALVLERERAPHRVYARPAPTSQSTGAGDTFAAALTLALAAGAEGTLAADIAAAAAGAVVQRDGTVTCSLDDLRLEADSNPKVIYDWVALANRVELYRQQSRRVVFTNGCFDLLHRGHLTLLNGARNLGDVLIVGLNSDASVRQLKGPDRPINPLAERAQVLAALSCVDHVVPFNDLTPLELINLIRPDVFVKGADYTHESLPEAQLVEHFGGRVELLPLLENRSTTGLIHRIQMHYADVGLA